MPSRRTVHPKPYEKLSKSVAKSTKDPSRMGPKPEDEPFAPEQVHILGQMHGVDPKNNQVLLTLAGGPTPGTLPGPYLGIYIYIYVHIRLPL